MISEKENNYIFSEENYLNYTKKDTILHVAITYFLKQVETTRTSSGPITLPLNSHWNSEFYQNIIITTFTWINSSAHLFQHVCSRLWAA